MMPPVADDRVLTWVTGGKVWIRDLSSRMEVGVPYEEWNKIIERIGRREPEADREAPP